MVPRGLRVTVGRRRPYDYGPAVTGSPHVDLESTKAGLLEDGPMSVPRATTRRHSHRAEAALEGCVGVGVLHTHVAVGGCCIGSSIRGGWSGGAVKPRSVPVVRWRVPRPLAPGFDAPVLSLPPLGGAEALHHAAGRRVLPRSRRSGYGSSRHRETPLSTTCA